MPTHTPAKGQWSDSSSCCRGDEEAGEKVECGAGGETREGRQLVPLPLAFS